MVELILAVGANCFFALLAETTACKSSSVTLSPPGLAQQRCPGLPGQGAGRGLTVGALVPGGGFSRALGSVCTARQDHGAWQGPATRGLQGQVSLVGTHVWHGGRPEWWSRVPGAQQRG